MMSDLRPSVLDDQGWWSMSLRIHRNLRLEAGVSLAMGSVFLISGVALLVWGVILVGILVGWVHWFITPGFRPSPVGWLVPTVCFLSGGVLFHFGRHLALVYPRWLHRATWLLGNVQPRKMLLTFPEGREASGKIAELREPGKPESSPPADTVEIRSPYWKIKDLAPDPVEVFREIEADGIVAMAANSGIIWGFRKPDLIGERPFGSGS